jgi:hypothetical protein
VYGTPAASKMYGKCCPIPAYGYFHVDTCE